MFKKMFMILALIGLMFAVQNVQAGSRYTVALTSYTIASSTADFAATYPTISGGVDIDQIVFITTNPISTSLLIGCYNNATSTTAAAAATPEYFVMTSSSAYCPAHQKDVYEYPYYNPLHLTNPAFFKAGGDTSHQVWANIHYR